MNRHLRALLFAGLATLSPLSPARAEEPQVLTGVAAVVNNDVITFGQLRDTLGALADQRLAGKTPEQVESIKQHRLAALNELIDRQLILQEYKRTEARRDTIPSIQKRLLDEHIETIIREQFDNDPGAFDRTLQSQGVTRERFRELEWEKMIIQAMRADVLKNHSTGIVAEPRIKEYYEKNKTEYHSEEQIHLRMIALHKPAAEPDKRRELLEAIRQKVLAGAAFEDLARMYGEGTDEQTRHGDLGWISRDSLSEPLTKEAFKLKIGQVSEIVEDEGTLCLLYCEGKMAAANKPLDEVRSEIEKKLAQEDRQKLIQDWTAKLRSKAFIKIF